MVLITWFSYHALVQKMWRLGAIALIFSSALAVLYLLANLTAQVATSEYATDQQVFHKFPSSIEELQNYASILTTMKNNHTSLVLLLFGSAYLFKQTFAIPGSVFLNLLAGAIFGVPIGFGLACILTASGATFCFLLARFAGRDFANKFFPTRMSSFKNKLEENGHRLPYFLLFLRLFPCSPNWAINMCSGVLEVPVYTFWWTVLVGLMPYNYICVQTGALLSTLRSVNDILTWTTALQLSGIALIALLPGVFSGKKSNCLKFRKNAGTLSFRT